MLSKYIDGALIDDATTEFAKCFVFYYQSKDYIESNKLSDMLVGQGPILVDKSTGKI